MSDEHPIFGKFQMTPAACDGTFVTNFLGAKRRLSYIQGEIAGRMDDDKDIPPASEEYFEWIDLLESIYFAENQYVLAELGAGVGRWCVAAHCAMRRSRGLPVHVIAVEAHPVHFEWLRENLSDNAISLEQCVLIEAAVGPRRGATRFYVNGDAAEWYGQSIWRPELPGKRTFRRAVRNVIYSITDCLKTKSVPMITLADVLKGVDSVDLLDVDIQDAEGEVIATSTALIDSKVKRASISTHSALSEEMVRNAMQQIGWVKLWDFPTGRESETPYGRIAFQDGRQSWIHPDYACQRLEV